MAKGNKVSAVDPLAMMARTFDAKGKAAAKVERPPLPGTHEAAAFAGAYKVRVHVPFDEATGKYASNGQGFPLVTGVYITQGDARSHGGRLRPVYVSTIADAIDILDADIVKAMRESAAHLATFWSTKATAKDRAMLAA